MAKTKVVIDPITRIEGHLRVTCVVENGKVTDAWNTCTLFRGFEIFMKDRDPREIWHYTMRICGVCPTPHGWNGVRATEMAMGVDKMDDNTRLIRNMMEASQIAYDHILWFYILNAFDYVNVPNALHGQAHDADAQGRPGPAQGVRRLRTAGLPGQHVLGQSRLQAAARPGPGADGALPAVHRDAADRQRRRRRVPGRQVPDDHELRAGRLYAAPPARGRDHLQAAHADGAGLRRHRRRPRPARHRPLLHGPRHGRAGRRQLPQLGGPRREEPGPLRPRLPAGRHLRRQALAGEGRPQRDQDVHEDTRSTQTRSAAGSTRWTSARSRRSTSTWPPSRAPRSRTPSTTGRRPCATAPRRRRWRSARWRRC